MKDLNATLLRYNQREDLIKDIENSERMLPKAKDEGVALLQNSIRRAKKQLNEQSPEPLSGKEKDTLNKLEKQLREKFTQNMPTQEVMRKNPAGAVDWHQRWEKRNKKLIRMWKNIKIQLNPDSQDRDLANIERYRPSGAVDRLRGDAQIPGVMSYHDIPEENWPFDPPLNTAAEQAKRRFEDADAETAVNAAIANLDEEDAFVPEEPKEKTPLTAEQKAVLVNRLALAREAKKQKAIEEAQVEEALTQTE